MKFQQLPVGQRFEWLGECYCKAGRLTASHEGSGQQRLIMRSADVRPFSAEPAPAAKPPAALTPENVAAAFAACEARWRAALPELSVETAAELEAAAAAFRQRLGLKGDSET